jgi:hypothetical protein
LIWSACSELRGIAAWQADTAEGVIELGKALTLGWPALGASVVLEVVELEPERRIAMQNGDARVEIVLDDELVTLLHSGLDESDDLPGLAASWQVALALLAHYCENHTGQRRAVHWFIGPTRCSAAAAYAFFTDEVALASWLTRRGAVPAVGHDLTLELASGAPLSGRVLANVADHDVAISWQEDDHSVLCMRSLPVAHNPAERLVALSWSRWTDSPAAEDRLEELGGAHLRLLRALDRRTWT